MDNEEKSINYNAPEYIRSRNAYIGTSTTYYFVSLLMTDAFLAKFLKYMGISDGMVGIITSLGILAFLFQLLTFFLIQVKSSIKKLVLLFDTISMGAFMLVYLFPFLPITGKLCDVLLVSFLVVAYGSHYMITNLQFKWAYQYVDPAFRGRYGAKTEMLSLATGIVYTILMGVTVDLFERRNNLKGAFLFLAVTILVINGLNFLFIMMIEDRGKEEFLQENKPWSEIFANTFCRKEFRSLLVVYVLYYMAIYMTAGFMGTFKTIELGMSLVLIEVINTLGKTGRWLCSIPFGRYADKYSYAKTFEIGIGMVAISALINMFTNEKTWYFVIFYTLIFNCSYAATNKNLTYMLFSYVDPDYLIHAMILVNCSAGVCGFFTSIIGGIILEVVQKKGNKVFGMSMYGQNLLAFFTFMISIVLIIYLRKVVENQKNRERKKSF